MKFTLLPNLFCENFTIYKEFGDFSILGGVWYTSPLGMPDYKHGLKRAKGTKVNINI